MNPFIAIYIRISVADIAAHVNIDFVPWFGGDCCCFLSLPSQLDSGKTFQVRMRFDTDVELAYFQHGGILNYMIRKMSAN